jgi:hypothetical protein
MRRALVVFASAALLGASPAGITMPGPAARALTMAFQFAAGRLPDGALNGLTVHVADQQGCYRIRFVPPKDSSMDVSTVRLGKAGDAAAAGCDDEPNAPEWVLPGVEAEALARVVRAWSNGALTGAPSADAIGPGAFSISVRLPKDDPKLAPGTVGVVLAPTDVKPGACPLSYVYAPDAGSITPLVVGGC